jgi:6-pyruvoyltetrahydropterin/6-carboxytetrahydropterin synthase
VFRVTRRYAFAASHRLHSAQLSDAANEHIYGKCNNPHGHGHNYTVEVSACGPVDDSSGLAVRISILDDLVKREILTPFDHCNLNVDTNAFCDSVPTTENLALEIGRRLKRTWSTAFPGEWPKLDKIRIAETERNIFELRADEV